MLIVYTRIWYVRPYFDPCSLFAFSNFPTLQASEIPMLPFTYVRKTLFFSFHRQPLAVNVEIGNWKLGSFGNSETNRACT